MSTSGVTFFTKAAVVHVLDVHGTGKTLCDIGDSPNSVATGKETVPTVSPAWASTHQDTTTEPFQTTTTAVGPVAWGKAGLDSGVDYFTSGRLEKTFLLFSSFKDAFESG